MANISKIKTPNGTTYDLRDNSKQETLVSGTNIKTINNTSLLGSGNITIQDTLSIANNVITLTRADGTHSDITLPVYNGSVS